MRDIERIRQYYEGYDEDGRLAPRHGQVEFLTTMHYIRRYLRPGMRVLEIGAGTGRYTLALAREGYRVDAIELLRSNLSKLLENIKGDMDVNAAQGDAVDLRGYAGETFDIVLSLGPMYHLPDRDDRKRAMREALRVTKPGGALFTAYCLNDATMIDWGFRKGNIAREVREGRVNARDFRCPPGVFWQCAREDIDADMEGMPVSRLHYVATDLFTGYIGADVDAMDDATWQLYLQYHLSSCERPDLIGISHHVLNVLRKH